MAEKNEPSAEQTKLPPDQWCQGDVILVPDGLTFVCWADLSNPLTPAAKEAAGKDGAGLDVISDVVEGFVVVTQTCDMVRDPSKRPFVELAKLVKAEEGNYKQIAKLAQPRYAVISAVADQRLVADLDCVMTVEKSVLANFNPLQGLKTETEQRQFARALARKRARAALPDGFNIGFEPVAKHLKAALKQKDAEALHLDALVEFRVKPEPSWQAEKVTATVYLFKGSEDPSYSYDWAKHTEVWEKLFKPDEQFIALHLQVVRYDQVDALTYLTSDELDFDNLSPPAA